MREAGIKHLLGIEINPKIAAVAQLNGFKTLVADVRRVDFAALYEQLIQRLFWLHASPPCIGASNANPLQGESDFDMEIAFAITQALNIFKPKFFTLENVMHYRSFSAFDLIVSGLQLLGYSLEYWNINMANYGVPQIRRRLILIAHRDGGVVKPFPTHSRYGDMFTVPWVGWYEALANRNLLSSLESCTFSDYQIKNFKKHNFDPAQHVGFLADVRHSRRRGTIRLVHEPSFTIVASQWKGHSKGRLPCGRTFKANKAVYAALQGVPTAYNFGKSSLVNQQIIGNGIPPIFAKKLAHHLISLT